MRNIGRKKEKTGRNGERNKGRAWLCKRIYLACERREAGTRNVKIENKNNRKNKVE